jgi:hypothetical protein
VRKVRQADRSQLFYYLKVYRGDTGEVIGRLMDINPHGLLVLSRLNLPPGSDLDLRLPLPSPTGDAVEVTLPSRSVWIKDSMTAGGYYVGFSIGDLSEEARELIEYAISDHAF